MTKHILAAIAVVVVLGGIGYVARARLFQTSSAAISPDKPAAVVEMAVATPPPPRPHDEAPATVVLEVDGRAERLDGTTWAPLAAHARLTPQDTIRTGDGAHVRIQSGASSIELGDRSEIRVGEMSTTVAEYMLDRGRVSAAVNAPTTRIRVLTRNDAIAEASAGRFAVLQSDAKHATVAAQAGSVNVRAGGRSVDVNVGEQTVVAANAAPSTPMKIPGSLFLKVGEVVEHGNVGTIRGETAPGARLAIGGKDVAADASGQFSTPISLSTGDNVIVLVVDDADGRAQRRVIHYSVARGPQVDARVQWK
ncbi:MAG TPA: FecR domain-containing protein [Kofleriaceae bacterium]|jgi:hypothetical protein|nr:FecR domain-containing protein [Kofleriaceae bacterium]